MTTSAGRRPGRVRDERARAAVLRAALELVADHPATLSIDAIARRAGVSRPTIYRWWPTKGAIVLDALLDATATAAPYPDTGDVRADVTVQMRRYVALLSGPLGPAYRSVFAEARRDDRAADELRERLIEPRRAVTRAVLRSAVDAGAVRAGVDLEAVIDALYGPLLYRLLLGHAPLDDDAVDALVAQLFDGIAA